MRNVQHVGFWACTLLVLIGGAGTHRTALGQPPSRGQNSFFDAMRQVHDENPDHEILDLLLSEKVRKLLDFDERDTQAFFERMGATMASMRALHKAQQGSKMPMDELKLEIVKIAKATQDEAFESLEKDKNLDRLIGIYVQVHGAKAAASNQVAKRINLTDEALKEFRAAKSEHWGNIVTEIRKEIDVLIRDRKHDSRNKMAQLMRDAKKQLNTALKNRLTPEQQQALAKLEGDEIPEIEKLVEALNMQRSGPRRRSGSEAGERREGERGRSGQRPGDSGKNGRPPSPNKDQACCSEAHGQNMPEATAPAKICLPIKWPAAISYIR